MPTTDQGAADPADVTTQLRHAEALLKTGALQSAIFDSVSFSSFATDAERDHHRLPADRHLAHLAHLGTIEAGAREVKQTIYNLLSNAVKLAVAHHPRHPACRYGRLAGPEPPPRGRPPEAERQGDGRARRRRQPRRHEARHVLARVRGAHRDHRGGRRGGTRAARSGNTDLVLMDIQLPGMDGPGVIAILEADQITRAIPVIALTALAMKGDEERIRAAGSDGYIAKPIRYQEFLAVIAAELARP